MTTGADPGFWFGGTGRKSWGRKSPSRVQGQSTGEGLGRSPQKPKECYVMRLKTTFAENKTSPYRLTLYDNIIIIIISSSHHFMFSTIFVLKYKTQSAGFRASKMVHNGSRA